MDRAQLPAPTFWYRVDRASSIAADLIDGEQYCVSSLRWTYKVIPDEDEPSEYAAIAVFDETGEFVTYWNEY